MTNGVSTRASAYDASILLPRKLVLDHERTDTAVH